MLKKKRIINASGNLCHGPVERLNLFVGPITETSAN